MADPVICLVFETEAFDDSDPKFADCKSCGMKAGRVTTDSPDNKDGYDAPIFYETGGLERWVFDDGDVIEGPYEYPDNTNTIHIDYPEQGFQHLCIRYNREGLARINVVAVDVDTLARIVPAQVPASGHDAHCPLKNTTGKSAPSLDDFSWDAGGFTVLPFDAQQRGAFTVAPANVDDDLTFTAKATLPAESLYQYRFQSWERNRLSKWVKGMEHQWTSQTPDITFDQNTFEGFIAYYKKTKIEPHWREPTTIPQPIDYGYPWPLGTLVGAIRTVIRRLMGRRA